MHNEYYQIEELFDDYIENKLFPQERIEFEERLNRDASLKKSFDLHKLIRSAVNREGLKRQAIKARLESNDPFLKGDLIYESDKINSPLQKVSDNKNIFLLLTCSAVITILIILLVLKSTNNPVSEKSEFNIQPNLIDSVNIQNKTRIKTDSILNDTSQNNFKNNKPILAKKSQTDLPEDIIAMVESDEYLEEDFPREVIRSGNDQINKLSLRQQAQIYFDMNQFEKARNTYEKVSNLHEFNTDYLKLGYCFLISKKPSEAVSIFEHLFNKDEYREIKSRVVWYLALSYAMTDKNKANTFIKDQVSDTDLDDSIKLRLSLLKNKINN